MSERYRLRASSRKKDKLTEIFPIEEIQKFIFEENHPNFFCLIYDRRRKRENHDSNYLSHIKGVLHKYFGVEARDSYLIPGNTDVITIKIRSENLKEIFPIIIDDKREFHFADQLYISRIDSGKSEKTLIISRKKYYKWLPHEEKFFVSSPVQIDKIPYKGRTTVENEEEKKLVKKILLEYLKPGSKVVECLLKDLDGRAGFEKLVLPGEEDHVHWRRKTERNLFEEFKVNSRDDLIRLIENDDAMCFYFPLTKEVDLDGKAYKIKHKFVVEYDPPTCMEDNEGIKIVAKISDVANSLCEELGIFPLYLFSGSKSARNQCSFDYENILENIEKIIRDFPFLGYAFDKKPKGIDDYYNGIVSRGLNSAFYLELVRKLAENKLLVRDLNNKIVPNITFNSRSELRALSILIDFPHSASISLGSPKLLSRDELNNLIILGCGSIERCPISKEERLKFNLPNLSNYFEANSNKILKKMEEKIEAKTLEKIFEGFINRQDEFHDFHTLKEEEFWKRYYNII